MTRKNNFIYLALALVLMLFTAALIESVPVKSSRFILDGVMIVIFLTAVRTLNLGSYWPHFGWTITIGLAATVLVHAYFNWKQADYIELILIGVLFIYITVRASRQVLLEGRIDANKIVGTLALFILIGLIFTVLYLLAMEHDPAALEGIDPRPWAQNFSQTAYFSFVTQSTLGFGDIRPNTRLVEFFVYFQAIIGVFYMAVFVAGLIGAAQESLTTRNRR